ncbi:MAG: ankyrin repeat domain-containing protein [Desulfurellaceae bacterium]|nr:ankyrin repeat domain-containing protein [Desulfurellaceae bacterium]
MHRQLMRCMVALLLTNMAAHAATLDVPAPHTTLSGIGVVHGWKCEAGKLTVRFDGGDPLPLAYGNARADTASVCGDTDNGFVSIMNWGNLGPGTHTAVVYDNGTEFDRSTFTVVTAGEAFLKDVEASCTIPDFPDLGDTGHFAWDQSTQHLELVEVEWAPPLTPDCARWPETDAFEDATPTWVRACLNAGVDIHAEYRNGFTPLHSAAHHGNAPVVQVLLEAGADVTRAKSNGYNPLHAALVEGTRNPEVVRLLLDAGADPHAKYRDTPAVFYAEAPVTLLQLFLDAGADPHIIGPHGQTLMHGAVYDIRSVRLLLSLGVNSDAATDIGRTPLTTAVGGMVDQTVVQLLINEGARVNVFSGYDRRTPLHTAVLDNRPALVSLLLSAGANPNVTDADGNTPLYFAERYGYDAIARLLRNAGARG